MYTILQFCTFDVHKFSNNVHYFVCSMYKIYQLRIFNIYIIFQIMYIIMYIVHNFLNNIHILINIMYIVFRKMYTIVYI